MRIYILLFVVVCFFEKCNTAKPLNNLQADNSSGYTYYTPSSDGTGKFYMGREIAKVGPASNELSAPIYDRETYERSDLVIKEIRLLPTDAVADIGAGTGYYTFKIVDKVPLGKVYAVEIQDDLINFLKNEKKELNYKNVEVIKGNETSPNLPDASIDLALLVKTYHELSYPHEMLQAIKKSLKPNGKVLLLEVRGEDATIKAGPLHKMKAKQIKKELIANGFKLIHRVEFLPSEHFMLFRKNNL